MRREISSIIEMRKSTAIWDIAMCVRDEVITMDELEGFSEDLIDAVNMLLKWNFFFAEMQELNQSSSSGHFSAWCLERKVFFSR